MQAMTFEYLNGLKLGDLTPLKSECSKSTNSPSGKYTLYMWF